MRPSRPAAIRSFHRLFGRVCRSTADATRTAGVLPSRRARRPESTPRPAEVAHRASGTRIARRLAGSSRWRAATAKAKASRARTRTRRARRRGPPGGPWAWDLRRSATTARMYCSCNDGDCITLLLVRSDEIRRVRPPGGRSGGCARQPAGPSGDRCPRTHEKKGLREHHARHGSGPAIEAGGEALSEDDDVHVITHVQRSLLEGTDKIPTITVSCKSNRAGLPALEDDPRSVLTVDPA